MSSQVEAVVGVLTLTAYGPLLLVRQRMTHRRNRLRPHEAREAVRRNFRGLACVHIDPRAYPLPPLEIIRIATHERAYVYAGSGPKGEMAFGRGDLAGRPPPAFESYVDDLRQHGLWPQRRRRPAPRRHPSSR